MDKSQGSLYALLGRKLLVNTEKNEDDVQRMLFRM